MSKPIKEWLSEESVEASRKSKMWASGKRVAAISKDELNDLQWWRLEMIDLLNFLRPNSVSGKILEIGAGDAHIINSLDSSKFSFTIVDFHKPKILPSNTVFINNNIDNIDKNHFEEKSFDCVVLDNVLEHLVDPFQMILKISYWLKKWSFNYCCAKQMEPKTPY